VLGADSRSWPAVEEHHRHALGIADLLEIKGVDGGYLQGTRAIRFDFGIKDVFGHPA